MFSPRQHQNPRLCICLRQLCTLCSPAQLTFRFLHIQVTGLLMAAFIMCYCMYIQTLNELLSTQGTDEESRSDGTSAVRSTLSV